MPSPEEAEALISELDGAMFKDRKLRVRHHMPYNPVPRFLRFIGGPVRKTSISSEGPPADEEAPATDSIEAVAESEEQDPTGEEAGVREIKYSDSTIFIKGIKHKASVKSLSEFFSEFDPINIKIIKPRGFIKGFKPRACNALISFKPLEDLSLDRIIESCKTKVFDGYVLNAVKAFASRDKFGAKEESEEENPVEVAADAVPELPERPKEGEESTSAIDGEPVAEDAPAEEAAGESS